MVAHDVTDPGSFYLIALKHTWLSFPRSSHSPIWLLELQPLLLHSGWQKREEEEVTFKETVICPPLHFNFFVQSFIIWLPLDVENTRGCSVLLGSSVSSLKKNSALLLGEKERIAIWRHIADFVIVQFSSVAQACPTLCDPMNRSMSGLPVHYQLRSLPKLMSIEFVMPSSHLLLCRPLLLLPPIPPSIRVFSNELTLCMRWPKCWSFSLSISPSNEHPGLISFRMNWLDLLAVQGTLKSLLQHHSSKASILWC